MNPRVHLWRRLYGVSAILVITLALSACSLTEVLTSSPAPASLPQATPTNFPTPALPTTESAFDHNTLVGQAAPAFTLSDANDQPYTFSPGKGRKQVIVFYMVYT
ncbi:MAG: hypothetical protein HY259_02725 [Chloroflexi bacterium]|nr:hypothetical protein [Chloroflexota bacterium]